MANEQVPVAAPPMWAVDLALTQAQLSPCAKSKRGAVVFVHDRDGGWRRGPASRRELRGLGRNGPALGSCDGSDACMESCGKRCVHAEMRAIRTSEPVARGADIVHVKIDEHGELVAGGGPSCWQCSREILDAGCKGVWLFEEVPGPPRYYTSADRPRWRYYTAADFHRATMLACDIYNPESPASAPTPTERPPMWRCSSCKQVFSPDKLDPSQHLCPSNHEKHCAIRSTRDGWDADCSCKRGQP